MIKNTTYTEMAKKCTAGDPENISARITITTKTGSSSSVFSYPNIYDLNHDNLPELDIDPEQLSKFGVELVNLYNISPDVTGIFEITVEPLSYDKVFETTFKCNRS